MIDFDRLFKKLSTNYYTDILMLVVEIISLIIALRFSSKTKIGRYFICYLLIDALMLIGDLFIYAYTGISNNFKNHFFRQSNNLIALIELLVYYYFFKQVLPLKKLHNLLKLLAFTFIAIMSIYISTGFSFLTKRHGYVSDIVSVIEYIFLLPPCLFFFNNLLNTSSKIKLFERPSFWIVTGIFFYSFISIPIYLIKRYVGVVDTDWLAIFNAALFNIPITINFCFLIKAFLCKKTLTT